MNFAQDKLQGVRLTGIIAACVAIGFIAIVGGCKRASPSPQSSDSPQSFTLNFPEKVYMGELWLIENVNCFTCGTGEKYLGRAVGKYKIDLPAPHWFVSLRMPKNSSNLLPNLAEPSMSNIGDIDLKESDVKDDDLRYLAKINLQSIDLSKTQVRGSGLRYLKPHKRWISVDLRDCDKLEPKYLAHFRGWDRATINVVPSTNVNSVHNNELINKAHQIICDGKPENICATQIR
jgi:hypothetical protein